ncbi:MAG: cell shape determination protein CcmA, partial [Chitinophagaceae bacterium]|nr:cell shape determination protein CcmA [Chitinophagaceae bacterium]
MKKFIPNKLKRLVVVFAAIAMTMSACKKDSDGSPDIDAGNMASGTINPGEAPGGEVIILNGAGIGDIRSIVFDKNNVPAPFQS